MKIIECVIDTEIFEKLASYDFKIIDFSPKIIGLRAIIGVVDREVVACAIVDYSKSLPNKLFYEIFYNFEEELEKLRKEIEFLENINIYVENLKVKKNATIKYKEQIDYLEDTKSYFRYNDFHYVVFIESLVKGNHYGCELIDYMKNKYENLVTLPFPRNVSVFWELRGFKEMNYMYFYRKEQ